MKGQLALPFEPYRIARGGRGRGDCDWLVYDAEGNEVQLACTQLHGQWWFVWSDPESLGMVEEYARVQAERLNRLAAVGVVPHPVLGNRAGRQGLTEGQRAQKREHDGTG